MLQMTGMHCGQSKIINLVYFFVGRFSKASPCPQIDVKHWAIKKVLFKLIPYIAVPLASKIIGNKKVLIQEENTFPRYGVVSQKAYLA